MAQVVAVELEAAAAGMARRLPHSFSLPPLGWSVGVHGPNSTATAGPVRNCVSTFYFLVSILISSFLYFLVSASTAVLLTRSVCLSAGGGRNRRDSWARGWFAELPAGAVICVRRPRTLAAVSIGKGRGLLRQQNCDRMGHWLGSERPARLAENLLAVRPRPFSQDTSSYKTPRLVSLV